MGRPPSIVRAPGLMYLTRRNDELHAASSYYLSDGSVVCDTGSPGTSPSGASLRNEEGRHTSRL